MASPESGWKVGRDHRLRWIELLQLNLVDTDTGAIGIDNVLRQFLHCLLVRQ
jgi:hypothetical protein